MTHYHFCPEHQNRYLCLWVGENCEHKPTFCCEKCAVVLEQEFIEWQRQKTERAIRAAQAESERKEGEKSKE